ncbi:cation diffusion facilitator family transporter [Acidovorax sp. Be4]|uniref:Cation diffusion facilitator family transporter n=1 Tax=Acidovorax bellezanensis TaxID=2976702 RepID=A0ABT2PIG9_9BURK|nr:cation diffusion facilitator family transporter [Acidovorax sp. Be4]MCT9809584.1 cation diffusion facilitator family transporter [Acidovorax sp. Be4]
MPSADHRPHDDHDHDHDDDHAGHSHGPGGHVPSVTAANARRIQFVFVMTLVYAAVQAVGGWLSGSLALIADAGHMLSDAAALLLALIAYRIAARAPDKLRTYGFHRVRVLAALANGASLLLLVAWIVWEAVARFRSPTEVMAGPMLTVAVIGLLVNMAGAWVLMRGHQGDGNLRGALLHVIGDLLGSVGAIAAAIGILLTGWTVLDPILSVLVAVLVVRSAWSLVSDSLLILLQAVPRGMDVEAAQSGIAALPEVAEVGHFHAWTLTDERVIATVHVTPAPGTDPLTLPQKVARQLREHHAIEHVTVQVDPPGSLQGPH